MKVNDHRPVNDSKVLFKHEFKVEGKGERTVKIPQRILDKHLYTYTGQEIRIRCFGKLAVNDKLIFEDSSVQKGLPAKALKKPSVSRDVQELIEPRDVFSLIKNFRAIPTVSKLAFIGLLRHAACALASRGSSGLPQPSITFHARSVRALESQMEEHLEERAADQANSLVVVAYK